MSRLEQRLRGCREVGKPVMGLFLTCGYPTREATLPLLHAIDEAGADFLELGMPFSDPVAEGLPIQHASEVALANGTRLGDVLETAHAFREESETPLVLMGYANPVFHYGVEAFCQDASAAGVDGFILPDLLPEESGDLERAARRKNLTVTYLVAPNTHEERVRLIASRSTGFVYAVSVTGLTGTTLNDTDETAEYLKTTRRIVQEMNSSLPLLVGFGISSPAEARRLSAHTDGFIVGSALIKRAERLWNDETLSNEDRLSQISTWVDSFRDQGSGVWGQ